MVQRIVSDFTPAASFSARRIRNLSDLAGGEGAPPCLVRRWCVNCVNHWWVPPVVTSCVWSLKLWVATVMMTWMVWKIPILACDWSASYLKGRSVWTVDGLNFTYIFHLFWWQSDIETTDRQIGRQQGDTDVDGIHSSSHPLEMSESMFAGITSESWLCPNVMILAKVDKVFLAIVGEVWPEMSLWRIQSQRWGHQLSTMEKRMKTTRCTDDWSSPQGAGHETPPVTTKNWACTGAGAYS